MGEVSVDGVEERGHPAGMQPGMAAFRQQKFRALNSQMLVDYIFTRLYNGCMKVKEIIKLLEEDDWYLVKTEGSHRQYKHPSKKGKVTVAGKPSDDVRKGTLNSILKQAGLR